MHSSAIEHTVCLTPEQTRGLQDIQARNGCGSIQEALRLAVDRLLEREAWREYTHAEARFDLGGW